jgi:hypothetical protein
MNVLPDGHATLSPAACADLMTSGAGADYVPGVDVQGNRVAAADLPNAASPATVDVAVMLRQRSAGRRKGGAIFGDVAMRDGHVFFNGKPLAADDQAAIMRACREAKR